MTKECNGWKNRQTWLVNLHLSSDETIYNLINRMSENCSTDKSFANLLRKEIESLVYMLPILKSDLGRLSLNRVDYLSIAKGWRE